MLKYVRARWTPKIAGFTGSCWKTSTSSLEVKDSIRLLNIQEEMVKKVPDAVHPRQLGKQGVTSMWVPRQQTIKRKAMDNNRKTMNKREIFMGHAYVFLFFSSTTVACCLVIFMWNSDFKML
ncbi:hypothetical protein NXW27_00475 [Phocaeicola dorei]|nr:hypothetical protein [Phocaeicola dorei]